MKSSLPKVEMEAEHRAEDFIPPLIFAVSSLLTCYRSGKQMEKRMKKALGALLRALVGLSQTRVGSPRHPGHPHRGIRDGLRPVLPAQ